MRDFVLTLGLVTILVLFAGGSAIGEQARTQASEEEQNTPNTVSSPDAQLAWQLVEVDGIRMTEFTREELLALVGTPARWGSLYFVNRTYERWQWTDGREVLLVRLDGASKFKVDRIIGNQLSVDGWPRLEVGDPATKAIEILGPQIEHRWGSSPKDFIYLSLSAHLEDGKVAWLNFQTPVLRPDVPLTGPYPQGSHK